MSTTSTIPPTKSTAAIPTTKPTASTPSTINTPTISPTSTTPTPTIKHTSAILTSNVTVVAATTTITPSTTSTNNKHLSPGIVPLQDEDLKPYDVLCGRGTGPNEYCGNKHFLSLVAMRRSEYIGTSSRSKKAKIAAEIIHQVQSATPPGRFLEKVKSSCKRSNSPAVWVEVRDEKKFLEKAKQALRETWHRKTPGESGSSSSTGSSSSSSSSGDDTASSSAIALAANSLQELSCKPIKRKIKSENNNNSSVFQDLSNRAAPPSSSSPSKKQKCSPSLPSPQSCVNFPKQAAEVVASLVGHQQQHQQAPSPISGSFISVKAKNDAAILNENLRSKHTYWPVPIVPKPSSNDSSSSMGQKKPIGMVRMF